MRNIRRRSETMLNQNLSVFCAMLNWVITLLLLATVAGFFVFAGTGGEISSLLARIAMAGCSVVAAVMLGVRLWHRSRHSKAS